MTHFSLQCAFLWVIIQRCKVRLFLLVELDILLVEKVLRRLGVLLCTMVRGGRDRNNVVLEVLFYPTPRVVVRLCLDRCLCDVCIKRLTLCGNRWQG